MRTTRSCTAGLAIVILWASPAVGRETPGVPGAARERYDEVYPYFRDDSDRREANEIATYAWSTSYALVADVDMFQATGDFAYVDRLLDKMANILANRDDARGVVDYRGVSMAAWRNVHYQLPPGVSYEYGHPDNDRYAYAYVVHSGMITYPMVALAELIRQWDVQGAHGGRSYQQWADLLIVAAEETVAAHDDQWVSFLEDEGYYRFRDVPSHFRWYANRNRDVPYNQSHALGRTLIVLYRLTGREDYYDKAWRLAQRFKRALALRPNDSYVWMYWQPPGVYSVTGAGEDISHAAINISFARLAYETDMVFDATDMQRFANTLTRNVFQDTTRQLDDGCGEMREIFNVSNFVGGSAQVNTYLAQTGRWLELAAFDAEVYTRIVNIYEYYYWNIVCTEGRGIHASQLIGFADLALYGRLQALPGRTSAARGPHRRGSSPAATEVPRRARG